MRNYETKIYNYIDKKTGSHVVKATTEHDGKTISAYAKCHPEDRFNLEVGTEIACKRLDIKIAEKRRAYAVNYAKQSKQYIDFLVQEKRRAKKSMERSEIMALDRKLEVNKLKAELNSLLENA